MKDVDFKQALALVARTALDKGVELSTLIEILCEAYKTAKNERPKSARPPKVGSFVVYWDPKKGPNSASVLEVLVLENHPFGLIKLRVHLNARPNYDVGNVAYSEKPAINHWSYRPGAGR